MLPAFKIRLFRERRKDGFQDGFYWMDGWSVLVESDLEGSFLRLEELEILVPSYVSIIKTHTRCIDLIVTFVHT